MNVGAKDAYLDLFQGDWCRLHRTLLPPVPNALPTLGQEMKSRVRVLSAGRNDPGGRMRGSKP